MNEEFRKQEVQEWLLSWFSDRGKVTPQNNQTLATDYFAAGWLTSMEVVEFVTEIEDRFAMQFSDRDLQDPRFVTIVGLAELIAECSTQECSTQTSESK